MIKLVHIDSNSRYHREEEKNQKQKAGPPYTGRVSRTE